MKIKLKKLLCVFLCAVMTCVLFVPAFAANDKTAFIVVSGMNTFPLYDNNNSQLYPLSDDSVKAIVKEITPAVLSFAVTKNYDELANSVLPSVYKAFLPIACDQNGNSQFFVKTDVFNGSVADKKQVFESEDKDELAVVRAGIQKFGADNTFFFNYDWRLNPLSHADALNDFIKDVKQSSDYKNISVAAFSMGGTVVCSYLYKYGSKDITSLSLCATAFQGTSCVGSIFSKDISFSSGALINRLGQLLRSSAVKSITDRLNYVLNSYGINQHTDSLINSALYKLLPRAFGELVVPVFGSMPGLWALCDDKSYEQAKAVIFTQKNSELIKTADEYHYNVQQKAKELLNEARSDTFVYIVAQYNMQGLPVSEASALSNNDFLIDVTYASGGAVSAPLGECLPSDYTQKADTLHNHISPDRVIDASPCFLPEHTWFIKNMAHVDFPYGDGTDFIMWLADSKTYVDVYSSNSYPQFMDYSYKTGKLTPLDNNTEGYIFFAFFNKITDFFVSIINRIKQMFN